MSIRLVPPAALAFRRLAFCGMMAFSSLPLRAGDPQPRPIPAPANEADTSTSEAALLKLTPEQVEKKKKAYIGLAALAGIVIAGLSLATLTILWGGRLRRQLRKSDPEIAAMDRSFWFLKPSKPSITRSSLPELQRPLDDEPPQLPPAAESP